MPKRSLYLPQGKLAAFQMNDKCAAGTGRFLDVMARVLNVPIEQLGPLSETSEHPATISNTCTVFAESEVISQLSAKVPLADIAAGIHNSVAKRVSWYGLSGWDVPLYGHERRRCVKYRCCPGHGTRDGVSDLVDPLWSVRRRHRRSRTGL